MKVEHTRWVKEVIRIPSSDTLKYTGCNSMMPTCRYIQRNSISTTFLKFLTASEGKCYQFIGFEKNDNYRKFPIRIWKSYFVSNRKNNYFRNKLLLHIWQIHKFIYVYKSSLKAFSNRDQPRYKRTFFKSLLKVWAI